MCERISITSDKCEGMNIAEVTLMRECVRRDCEVTTYLRLLGG